MQRELEKNPDRERWVRPRNTRTTWSIFVPIGCTTTVRPGSSSRRILAASRVSWPSLMLPLRSASPEIYEVPCRFTTQKAGITVDYAYSIPKELENFWFQTGDDFARPELWVDWFEIEGPLYDAWPPKSHTSILFDSPLRESDERAYAREVLARFMRRAYRRPVTDQEVDEKLRLYDLVRERRSVVRASNQDSADRRSRLAALFVSGRSHDRRVRERIASAQTMTQTATCFTDNRGRKLSESI